MNAPEPELCRLAAAHATPRWTEPPWFATLGTPLARPVAPLGLPAPHWIVRNGSLAAELGLADWLQGYGLVVVVEHGKGDMSLYGYNQSALVSVGAQVKAGQPIALVGTSGGRGTPSLYFEIRRQGQAVNPLPWLGR